MTTASVPVPVASEDLRELLGTLCLIKVPVLLSVATCTAPTMAVMVNVAFVTRMILIVPGAWRPSMRRVIESGSPARTALVTPTVQKHSIQTGPDCSRSTTSCFIGTAVMSPTIGIAAFIRTAKRPRYRAGSPHVLRDVTLEHRGIGQDLVIENGPRSEDASSSRSGRNDPMHALQIDD